MAVAESGGKPPPNKSKGGKQDYVATVPPQEILPIIDSRFESSVRGIFIIGDVTGLPLVKVAANQGVEAMEKMAERGVFKHAGANDERLDLVIVGAGPAGLSAAVEAEKRGLKYVVLERSKAASTVRSFPPGKKVYSEPRFLKNMSSLAVEGDREKAEFLGMVEQVRREYDLKIKEETEVATVQKKSEHNFELTTTAGKVFPARAVLIAVGRQGQPRLLDVPGSDKAEKVTYRLHTADDYHDKDVLVVGGGNSAIEAALMLMEHNRVTLSYRGDNFYRAKEDNYTALEEAEQAGKLTILRESNVKEIRDTEVDIDVAGQVQTLPNDNTLILIGTLPPVGFLRDMGLELDGVWTKKRVFWSVVGVLVGIFVYFYTKNFQFLPHANERAAEAAGKLYVPWLAALPNVALGALDVALGWFLPVAWLLLAGLGLINWNMVSRGHAPLRQVPLLKPILFTGAFVYLCYLAAPTVGTLNPEAAGPGPYYVPGLAWLYTVVPEYFRNAYGFYYLLYFSGIAGFGLYWAFRYNHRLIWRRNLIMIATQWTLWWGIPTFLVVFIGKNPWTPLIARSLNAWPLNMTAFNIDNVAGPGDPAWWRTVAIVGVVWAVVLTFIVVPLMTLFWGKVYCSYVCSCGALAETVGNSFRHRGPKTDWSRNVEKFGFVFIPLAALATVLHATGVDRQIGDQLGFTTFGLYNVWVGTFLAGALAIGLYPFLGQRVWCRFWCPLAFWMNFWGRWSRFKISPEKGKCIDCNVCNQYCQMGIDIKTRALQGAPVTLQDTPCVACGECVVRCPMEILHLGEAPDKNTKYPDGTDAGPNRTREGSVHDVLDLPRYHEMSHNERTREGKQG